MTSHRFTITQQREAVENLIDLARRSDNCARGEWEAAAKQAVLTLGYLERNPDFARALALVMREFPQASVEVR